MKKIHIVTVINEMGGISNKAFTKLEDAIAYYEYESNLQQDKYSNGVRHVYLTEDVNVDNN